MNCLKFSNVAYIFNVKASKYLEQIYKQANIALNTSRYCLLTLTQAYIFNVKASKYLKPIIYCN